MASLSLAQVDPMYRRMIPGRGVILHDDRNLLGGQRLIPQAAPAAPAINRLGTVLRTGAGYWMLPADADTDAPGTAITLAAVLRVHNWSDPDAGLVGRLLATSGRPYTYAFKRDGFSSAIKPYLSFQDGTWLSPLSIAASAGVFYTAVLRWEDGGFVDFEVFDTLTGKAVGSRRLGPKFGALTYAGPIQELRIGRNEANDGVDVDVSAVIISPQRWTDAETRAFVDAPFFYAPSRYRRPKQIRFSIPGQAGVAGTPIMAWQALPAASLNRPLITRVAISLEALHSIHVSVAPIHRIELALELTS